MPDPRHGHGGMHHSAASSPSLGQGGPAGGGGGARGDPSMAASLHRQHNPHSTRPSPRQEASLAHSPSGDRASSGSYATHPHAHGPPSHLSHGHHGGGPTPPPPGPGPAGGYYGSHHGHHSLPPPGGLPPSNGRHAPPPPSNGYGGGPNGHARDGPYESQSRATAYGSSRERERERERDRERERAPHDRERDRERERERDALAREMELRDRETRERERLYERDAKEREKQRERERERSILEHQKTIERQQERDRRQTELEVDPRRAARRERDRAIDRERHMTVLAAAAAPPPGAGCAGGRPHAEALGVSAGPASGPLAPGQPGASAPPLHPIQAGIQRAIEGPFAALAGANEQTWLLIGAVSEQLSDTDRALTAYENALRHNPASVSALTQVGGIARGKEDFAKAIEFYQRVLNISQENGEVWGSLGHCYLMMDDLQKAYTAYQQALYRLPNPKDPKLWYGIGILYDRYGSLEHAEEAFSSVLRMEPNFEKANEIYFRLGIIYKQQHKFAASLECFRYILGHPPRPLTEVDIWFQIGHVHEQQKDYNAAKDAYERVLADNPNHAKVLQQLGWLYHQPTATFANQDSAIAYLTKSLEADPADAQSWYLLGRAFMGGQKYNKAYEAYQQAVYRDGRNPTFWCSIGVLYYQINQYRDALDAYSRAIRLNPFISEVWFDLGSLYESCNNQVNDAIDAYTRASDLDPANATVKNRLHMLKNAQKDGVTLPPPPPPQDVHPTAYAQTGSRMGFPGQAPPPTGGLPGLDGPAPQQQLAPAADSGLPVVNGRDLAAPPPQSVDAALPALNPFRSGAPPPLANVDESRGTMARHAPLAPMETERNGAVLAAAPANGAIPPMRPESAASTRPRYEDPRAARESPRAGPGYPSPYVADSRRAFDGPPPAPRQADPYGRDRPRNPRDERDARPDHRAPSGAYRRMSPPLAVDRRSPGPYGPRYGGPPGEQKQDAGRHTPAIDGGLDRRHPGRYDALSQGRGSPSVAPSVPSKRGPPSIDRESSRSRAEDERRRDGPRDGPEPETKVPSPTDSSRNGTPAPNKKKRKTKAASGEQASEPNGSRPDGFVSKAPSPEKPAPASRPALDEDYDEGAADALMGLAGYRNEPSNGYQAPAPIARMDPDQIAFKVAADNKAVPRDDSANRKRAQASPSPGPDQAAKKQKTASDEAAAASSTPAPEKKTTTIIEVLNAPSAAPTTESAKSPAASGDPTPAVAPAVPAQPQAADDGEIDEIEEDGPTPQPAAAASEAAAPPPESTADKAIESAPAQPAATPPPAKQPSPKPELVAATTDAAKAESPKAPSPAAEAKDKGAEPAASTEQAAPGRQAAEGS